MRASLAGRPDGLPDWPGFHGLPGTFFRGVGAVDVDAADVRTYLETEALF